MRPFFARAAGWLLAAGAVSVAAGASFVSCGELRKGSGARSSGSPTSPSSPGAPSSPTATAGQAAPAGDVTPGSCVECHRSLHPKLVDAHEMGPHGGKASCAECHGTDHALIFSIDGQVSSATCGKCHATRYEEFKRSKHGKALKQGAMADTLVAHAVVVGGCQATNGCHDVQRVNVDGSIGRCASCHASHAATRGVAADPGICARCHSGPDHPQTQAWANDKHGVLWKQDPTSSIAPSCATCHMPGKTHDDSLGLTASVVARPGGREPTLVPVLPRESHDKARAAMVAVCAACHGARLSKVTLDAADEARYDALLLCEEAAQIVRDLDAEGLLVPAPKDRPENPVSGGKLALGGKQIYDEGSSRAERLFYDMFMFQFPGLWRAAYHTDPNLVRWTEREKLKTSLIELRAEAERLRAAKATAPPER